MSGPVSRTTEDEFIVASAAVAAALESGAVYADARVVRNRRERIGVLDDGVSEMVEQNDEGISVRALVGSSWGFQGSAGTSIAAAERAGRSAYQAAAAGTALPGPAFSLLDTEVNVAEWTSPRAIEPWDVTADQKTDLLLTAAETMLQHGADRAEADYTAVATDKWLVSSEGHRIFQSTLDTSASITATVQNGGESQRRSYPGFTAGCASGGWEHVLGLDLIANAARVADEAQALARAPLCPSGDFDLILSGHQMAMQIHETVAHAIEIDRILGWEAGLAGTSWLELPQIGRTVFGSRLMNITIDPTIPGAPGGYRYDDEGTTASRQAVVHEGIWVGALASRDTAVLAGLQQAGNTRGVSWQGLPMVRISSVGIDPGPHETEELIAETKHGILIDANRAWSVDDRRLNFQFGGEFAWEIKNGRRTRMVRNPAYGGTAPTFWRSLDMLSRESQVVGLEGCGKGQPAQVATVSHRVSPARFRGVEIGAST